jgi:L-iditol 2-dehydrogenase
LPHFQGLSPEGRGTFIDTGSPKTLPGSPTGFTPKGKSMRALILERPGSIVLAETAIPEPGVGEILIRVEAATTCGTDLKAYLRGHPQIPMPGLFGHEYAGIVVEVGEGAPFAAGDAVMGVHSAPCQTCRWCLRNQENLCETVMATKVLGTYAEFLLIPERIARLNVFPKPAEIPFERASLLEPLSCVAQGLMNYGLERFVADPKMEVLIFGPGAIGLMFVSVLKYLGVENVSLAGRNLERLDVGRRQGARTILADELGARQERCYDLVVECTGSVEVWERSLDYACRGGTAMLFGGCPSGSKACFDTKRVHYDQITMISPFHFGTDAVRTARRWLLDPLLRLDDLLSGSVRLEDAPEVFENLKAGKGIKYVFRP